MTTVGGWVTVDVEETVPGGVVLLLDQMSLIRQKGNILKPKQIYGGK